MIALTDDVKKLLDLSIAFDEATGQDKAARFQEMMKFQQRLDTAGRYAFCIHTLARLSGRSPEDIDADATRDLGNNLERKLNGAARLLVIMEMDPNLKKQVTDGREPQTP